MARRAVDYFFTCKLDTSSNRLHKVKSGVFPDNPDSPVSSVILSVEEVAISSWHTDLCEVFPEPASVGKLLNSIPQNIFPRGVKLVIDEDSAAPTLHQFVLTSADYTLYYVSALTVVEQVKLPQGLIVAGHRGNVYSRAAYGIVSRVSYPVLHRAILSQILGHLHAEPPRKLDALISYAMCCIPLPSSPDSVVVCYPGRDVQVVLRTELGSFRMLFDLMSLPLVVQVVSALLLEQKVVLVSSRWSSCLISQLCEALRALLHPFEWHHVYVPTIPESTVQEISDVTTLFRSAKSSDHVHPLKSLEAPSPVFAGLKVTNLPAAVTALLNFQDLNIVDLDTLQFTAATARVDGKASPLPQLPRRASAALAGRLRGMVRGDAMKEEKKEEWAERLSHMESFDRIEPHVIRAQGSLKRLKRRVKGREVQRGWMGSFSALFRPEDASSPSNAEVQSHEEDFEEEAKAAWIEALARFLYPYRDFILKTSTADTLLFEGGDRQFQTDGFLKALSRGGGFSTEDVEFIKCFTLTQSWDMFIRTAALGPKSALLDSACGLYKALNKEEMVKLKSYLPKAALPHEPVIPRIAPSKTRKDQFSDEVRLLVSSYVEPRRLIFAPRFIDLPFQCDPEVEALKNVYISANAVDDADVESIKSIISSRDRKEHLFWRIIYILSGKYTCRDPALIPLDRTPQGMDEHNKCNTRYMSLGWLADKVRLTLQLKGEFENTCVKCRVALPVWEALDLGQFCDLASLERLSYPCPSCQNHVNPSLVTPGGIVSVMRLGALNDESAGIVLGITASLYHHDKFVGCALMGDIIRSWGNLVQDEPRSVDPSDPPMQMMQSRDVSMHEIVEISRVKKTSRRIIRVSLAESDTSDSFASADAPRPPPLPRPKSVAPRRSLSSSDRSLDILRN